MFQVAYSRTYYKNEGPYYSVARQIWATVCLICLCYFTSNAQSCPTNIDFENGTFSGWTCHIGSVAAVNGQNVISVYESGPIDNRHTMYDANSGILDQYGGFPVNCPNGSGHSIRLGNNTPGTEAEAVSYEFTIPANRDVYSLVYHYAVVFQDPNHQQYEQPRMEIEILNVTDNTVISCSSFTSIPYGSVLPGFFLSPNPGGDTPVWCKDWSAVSINLNGKAGKTIRLSFKTADCTFRRHFGYAYVDVNSECSSEFTGATFCKDDTAVLVTAPYGYQSYKWFNNGFSQTLGTQQTLTLRPPPTPGSSVAVQVEPYNGYGCVDTFYARFIDTLSIKANAGQDILSCNRTPVQIGASLKQGFVYTWSPAAGLSNSTIANPRASPDITTAYVLTARHDGGGCLDSDTVVVRSVIIDSSLQLIGEDMYCVTSGDSAVLRVQPADNIQWYRDNAAIQGANGTDYRVPKTGLYYAKLFKNPGCSLTTVKQNIIIDEPKPGINYPVQYAVIDLPLVLQARQFGETALWTPANNLSSRTLYNPVFKGSSEQLYTIEIETKSGCLTVDTQLVKTVKNVEIYVPTAFSPNSDGQNDLLRPITMGIQQLRYFKIFNRWGQLIYEMNAGSKGWDGQINGAKQGTQTVVWMAEGLGLDGKVYIRKGTSILIR